MSLGRCPYRSVKRRSDTRALLEERLAKARNAASKTAELTRADAIRSFNASAVIHGPLRLPNAMKWSLLVCWKDDWGVHESRLVIDEIEYAMKPKTRKQDGALWYIFEGPFGRAASADESLSRVYNCGKRTAKAG